ncbi:helix-turn-helix domain-containing protein [Dactylosporangium sp. CA-139114]|uniref:helix-turn-helix transcriptional regulator n=1 Tax=Dactylosporangium sp. CA-139114 TaxID=3239931 RepID=UPI003D98D63E
MPDEEIDALAALADPRRRAVYEHVAAAGEAVSRDQVAAALGIGRTLAAHHLDRLAEAGLLDVAFARLGGRSGPGAGRPSKLYRRSAAEHSVSLPPRGYRVLAEVFAEAVSEAGVEPALYAAAERTGARLKGQGAEATLRGLGYEPYAEGGVWRLRNCPFDAVARTHPGVVCGANLALLRGALGSGVRIDPRPDGCCVVVDRFVAGAGARDDARGDELRAGARGHAQAGQVRSDARDGARGDGLGAGAGARDDAPCDESGAGARDHAQAGQVRSDARDDARGDELRAGARGHAQAGQVRSDARDGARGDGLGAGADARDGVRGDKLGAGARDDARGDELRAGARDDAQAGQVRSDARDDARGDELRAGARGHAQAGQVRSDARDGARGDGLGAGADARDGVRGDKLGAGARDDARGDELRAGARDDAQAGQVRSDARDDARDDKSGAGARDDAPGDRLRAEAAEAADSSDDVQNHASSAEWGERSRRGRY